jgi:hypothetical protein
MLSCQRHIGREGRMHIHNNPLSSQMMALGYTQRTQEAMAVRKTAADVRRKLTSFAATNDDEAVSRVDPRSDTDPDRRRNQQQEEVSFRSVFFSASV